MSTSRPTLLWAAAILTLIAYFSGLLFILQGVLPLGENIELISNSLAAFFAITNVLACLVVLFATGRVPAPEHPAILRLPKSRPAKWALVFTVLFYPAIYLFTGNTLFNILRTLNLPDERFRGVLWTAESIGLWVIVICAVGSIGAALTALIKNKERALAIAMPLYPVFLVLGFIIGEFIGHE